MDHGQQTKDGVSLAGAGSEAVQTCSKGSPTSYYGYASCPVDVVAAFLELALHVVSQ